MWPDGSFNRFVRSEDDLRQESPAILNNPRKRWPECEEDAWLDGRRRLEPA